MPLHDIIVVGASGHTAALCVDALVKAGLRVLLAGRSADRLLPLTQRHGGLPVAVLDLDQESATAAVLATARVVLGCAGPFAGQGLRLVRAAIAAGRPYLDISGELAFYADVAELDQQAVFAGVSLVPCVGFDAVVGEVTAVLAARQLGEPVDQVVLSLATTTKPSRGSVRTLWQGLANGGYDVGLRRGALQSVPVATETWHAVFPSPVGRSLVAQLGQVELAIVQRVLAPREARTGVAVPFPPGLRLAAALARWCQRPGWLSQAAARLVAFVLDRLPAGATTAQQAGARSWQHVRVVAANGKSASLCARTGDVGQWTAICAAICVQLQLQRPAKAGLLTPTQAYGVDDLAAGLRAHGLQWDGPV